MRTLSLLRHAKSSWDDNALTDFERPLAPRGEAAAPLMGRHMRDIGLAPDLVICSAALRTRETARLALAEFGGDAPPIVYDERIYEASTADLLSRLQEVDAAIEHVLMIGHNPGLQRLVLQLTGGRLGADAAQIAEKLPTGALVVMALDIARWEDLKDGVGRVTHYMTPRRLQDG